MALDTYADLQSAVASWLHRDDLTAQIPDFIRLAEADMQVRAKLSQWETEASVSLTNGSGALPPDVAQVISVKYGSQSYTISHMAGEAFDNVSALNGSGEPEFYTIRGSNLLVTPTATGTATVKYTARFTPLSTVATSNSLLALFPDAYLNGALMHASSWLHDAEAVTKYAAFFESSMKRVKSYVGDYKYPYALQMRAA